MGCTVDGAGGSVTGGERRGRLRRSCSGSSGLRFRFRAMIAKLRYMRVLLKGALDKKPSIITYEKGGWGAVVLSGDVRRRVAPLSLPRVKRVPRPREDNSPGTGNRQGSQVCSDRWLGEYKMDPRVSRMGVCLVVVWLIDG